MHIFIYNVLDIRQRGKGTEKENVRKGKKYIPFLCFKVTQALCFYKKYTLILKIQQKQNLLLKFIVSLCNSE